MNRKQRRTVRATKMKNKSPEQLQAQYMDLCAKAGDLQYRISVMKQEAELFKTKLSEVNVEIRELNKVYSKLSTPQPASEDLTAQPEAATGEPSTEEAVSPDASSSVPPSEVA